MISNPILEKWGYWALLRSMWDLTLHLFSSPFYGLGLPAKNVTSASNFQSVPHTFNWQSASMFGFAETGFFLVVWLNLKNMTFTFPLANQSSTQYQKTEKEVLDAVWVKMILITGHWYKHFHYFPRVSGTNFLHLAVRLFVTDRCFDKK